MFNKKSDFTIELFGIFSWHYKLFLIKACSIKRWTINGALCRLNVTWEKKWEWSEWSMFPLIILQYIVLYKTHLKFQCQEVRQNWRRVMVWSFYTYWVYWYLDFVLCFNLSWSCWYVKKNGYGQCSETVLIHSTLVVWTTLILCINACVVMLSWNKWWNTVYVHVCERYVEITHAIQCLQRGLNSRPLVYKTSALPLSYRGYMELFFLNTC